MKTLLLYILIFISLGVSAQFKEALKVEPIFNSEHYTITIACRKGEKTYEFTKRKTARSTAWLMKRNRRNKKIIWDNYQTLQKALKQNAYNYYSIYLKHPTLGSVTYTISNQNQSITFEAGYINIPKMLRHIGFTDNTNGHNGSTVGGGGRSQHG